MTDASSIYTPSSIDTSAVLVPSRSSTPSVVPSVPDNTPEGPLTPQLAIRSHPLPLLPAESDVASVDSAGEAIPIGFTHNEGKWRYPIYVPNPTYTRAGGGRKHIMAPYIQYTDNYTIVHGSAGIG